MATNSNIEWNPLVGYDEEALADPFKWKEPQRVFVNSMSDLFHEDVPFDFIDRVFAVMALCPRLTFQILTKRPERMAEYFEQRPAEVFPIRAHLQEEIESRGWSTDEFLDRFDEPSKRLAVDILLACENPELESKIYISQTTADAIGKVLDVRGDFWLRLDNQYHAHKNEILPNVWLGVSVEDQATADERIPHLLRCPASVRFLSMEPLLGPVDLQCVPGFYSGDGYDEPWMVKKSIHQIIVGGESGKDSRPMHPDWVRSLRDQAVAAGVAFFFKQWGNWVGGIDFVRDDGYYVEAQNGEVYKDPRDVFEWEPETGDIDQPVSVRVPKYKAGRMLDGRTWDEMPGKTIKESTNE